MEWRHGENVGEHITKKKKGPAKTEATRPKTNLGTHLGKGRAKHRGARVRKSQTLRV